MDLFLDYTAKNEIDALFVSHGVPFASVPALEHALAPTSRASPLFADLGAGQSRVSTATAATGTDGSADRFSRVSDQADAGTPAPGSLPAFESYSKVRVTRAACDTGSHRPI